MATCSTREVSWKVWPHDYKATVSGTARQENARKAPRRRFTASGARDDKWFAGGGGRAVVGTGEGCCNRGTRSGRRGRVCQPVEAGFAGLTVPCLVL
jgi:hypothetical protein